MKHNRTFFLPPKKRLHAGNSRDTRQPNQHNKNERSLIVRISNETKSSSSSSTIMRCGCLCVRWPYLHTHTRSSVGHHRRDHNDTMVVVVAGLSADRSENPAVSSASTAIQHDYAEAQHPKNRIQRSNNAFASVCVRVCTVLVFASVRVCACVGLRLCVWSNHTSSLPVSIFQRIFEFSKRDGSDRDPFRIKPSTSNNNNNKKHADGIGAHSYTHTEIVVIAHPSSTTSASDKMETTAHVRPSVGRSSAYMLCVLCKYACVRVCVCAWSRSCSPAVILSVQTTHTHTYSQAALLREIKEKSQWGCVLWTSW